MASGNSQSRVLVVDDEPELLAHYDQLFKLHGYDVTTCQDSTTVLELLKAAPYDIALLDIRMPGIEGTDLVPMIKHLRPDLPIVLISAFCDERDRGYYHSLGVFEILSKPFSNETVLEVVGRALDQQERIPLVLRSLSLMEGRDQVYRKLVLTALGKTHWNQVKAAALLGVSRYCLIRWMRKLGITG